jgi:preprotein translocase subunit SecG
MNRDTSHTDHADHAGHAGHDMGPDGHEGHEMGGLNSMALSATLHCLTGCAIGEIAGLMIGTAIGLSTGWTIVLAVSLAFLFGYTLSTFPLVKAGLGAGAALAVVFAADTLSIATMELVDNAVMAAIPGAMEAGLVNWVFWVSMMIALTAAFLAAYPVNRYLLARGKGHALTHAYHGDSGPVTGARRFIPNLSSTTLAAVIVAFMLGGLVVSVADELSDGGDTGTHATSTSSATD